MHPLISRLSTEGNIQLGFWREVVGTNRNCLLTNLPLLRSSRYKESAIAMRNGLKDYVNSNAESVSWKLDHVRRT